MNYDITIQRENEYVSKNRRTSYEEEIPNDDPHSIKLEEFSQMYSRYLLNFINQIVQNMN